MNKWQRAFAGTFLARFRQAEPQLRRLWVQVSNDGKGAFPASDRCGHSGKNTAPGYVRRSEDRLCESVRRAYPRVCGATRGSGYLFLGMCHLFTLGFWPWILVVISGSGGLGLGPGPSAPVSPPWMGPALGRAVQGRESGCRLTAALPSAGGFPLLPSLGHWPRGPVPASGRSFQ